MNRVAHLQQLARSSRNLANQMPPDRAAELLQLADQYERDAEKRRKLIASGIIETSSNVYPGHSD